MTNKVNPPIAALSTADFSTPQGKRALIDVINQVYQRIGGPVDVIADIEVQQTGEDGGNRTYRRFRDEIDDLHGQIAEQKRHARNLEQQIFMLVEMVDQAKTRNRTLEQELNEIIERVDSGT